MIGTTISHYKIVEKLGEGGMGIVYKAQDLNLDRHVAIKLLSPQLSGSEENRARLSQEARAAASLNHKNILGVHEINEHDGSVFLVMEFVEGQTLRNYISGLATGTGLPAAQAMEWVLQIAGGLKAAHSRGIVHRDIKSENIMIDGSGNLKIMDFGLAKLKGARG